jgi:hypothetical protein
LLSDINTAIILAIQSGIAPFISMILMEGENKADDQSFQIEMLRQLKLLPNKFHQKSEEDIDHLNEVSIEEAKRQLSITAAAMKLFSNFEKVLPIGPIAAKKLGGFANTSKDQSKT